MTEAQWLTTDDVKWLLCCEPLQQSWRKIDYFHVACCQAVSREQRLAATFDDVIAQVEQGLDGLLSPQADTALDAHLLDWHGREVALLRRAVEEARGRNRHFVRDQSIRTVAVRLLAEAFSQNKPYYPWWRVTTQIDDPLEAAQHAAGDGRLEQVCQQHIVALRDIFGNPFRPVVFSPTWQTNTAIALARQMYESRDFGAMPILADALQDAGCDNGDILTHCRNPEQIHVRGCWVVDLVLGKE